MKTRIVARKHGDGKVLYYPEYKWLFFWLNFKDESVFSMPDIGFKDLEKCKDHIRKMVYRDIDERQKVRMDKLHKKILDERVIEFP